jgi:parallel beta-helix repeat protein
MPSIGKSVAGAVLVLALLSCSCAPALAQGPCSYTAALSGSDHSRGSASRPFRTVQHLVDRLRPGQIGCVRGGTYQESVTISQGGSGARARVTLKSYPGERATLVGRLYIRRQAPYVTVANMNLNGRNPQVLPSPDIAAENDQFIGNDVTDEHTEICFILGSPSYGRARNTLIARNRIHDCGREPAQNGDHGIYVAFADNTHIVGNVIFKNADRGIQLYPDAQGTVIEHNILDSNGEDIAIGGERTTSSNSRIAFNLITNSTIGFDVQSHFPPGTPAGANNLVRSNCIFGGAEGHTAREIGFVAAHLGNRFVDPHYANAAGGDYRVARANPCAKYVAPGTPVTPF